MEDVLAHRPGGRIAWRAGKVTSSTRRRRLRPSTVNLLCLTQIWHPLSPSLERLGLDVFKLRNFTSPSFPFSGRVKTRFFSSTALVWLAFNAFLALRVYPEAEVIHNPKAENGVPAYKRARLGGEGEGLPTGMTRRPYRRAEVQWRSPKRLCNQNEELSKQSK